MAATLPDPLYYLANFRQVLAWVEARHSDLLDESERKLLVHFSTLPQPAQAMLVRLVMRKGTLFRHSKLVYAEIGETALPLEQLAARGLVNPQPTLSLAQLFGLLRKDELLAAFGMPLKNLRKDELFARLQERFPEPRPLADWHASLDDAVVELLQPERYDLLRLLFFGNLHQDWSEFVLTDLGHLKYEPVALDASAGAFRNRADVEAYRHLYACRERLEAGENPRTILADVPGAHETVPAFDNPWLEERRARLLFAIGQALERGQDWAAALAAYQSSHWPEARLRAVRVLEQDGQLAAAFAAASALQQQSAREADQQQLARTLPRLRHQLGLEKLPVPKARAPARMDFALLPQADMNVEWRLREHLHTDHAPVFYVENALINSLFGLLCWPAIFAPLPGAFFHAFHSGPADLHSPDFTSRRATEFAQCLAQLESGAYRETILANWQAKAGTQSPFVFWDTLDEALLTLALDIIPPAHLRALFTRLLADIKSNRSGFPDLIQFWPEEKRYLMLEVKGPGDRLQDNQVRWLDYCHRHDIPVAVAYVSWVEA